MNRVLVFLLWQLPWLVMCWYSTRWSPWAPFAIVAANILGYWEARTRSLF